MRLTHYSIVYSMSCIISNILLLCPNTFTFQCLNVALQQSSPGGHILAWHNFKSWVKEFRRKEQCFNTDSYSPTFWTSKPLTQSSCPANVWTLWYSSPTNTWILWSSSAQNSMGLLDIGKMCACSVRQRPEFRFIVCLWTVTPNKMKKIVFYKYLFEIYS